MERHKEEDHTGTISNAILLMLSMLVLNEIILNSFSKLKKRFEVVKVFINNTMITTLLGMLAGAFLIFVSTERIISSLKNGFS